MPSVSNRVRTTILFKWHSADSPPYRLPSGTPGTHCTDCVVIVEKARRRSMAVAASNLPPDSAKIRKILELLVNIDVRDDEEKTIIFSQFTSMLDLIQPFLRAEGIKHVRCEFSVYLRNVCRADDSGQTMGR